MKPFSQLSGQGIAVELLRWLLVPAAALAMVYVPTVVMRAAMPPSMAPHPGQARPGPDPIRITIGRVARVLMGAAFVIAGAMMAPRKRFGAALVLAGLWIAYGALIHIVVHLEAAPHYLDFSLAVGAAALGVMLVRYLELPKSKVHVPNPEIQGPSSKIYPSVAFAFDALIRHD